MDEEHPEWLPPDWKVCVRVRSTGKKDKYYINPSNGLKCNSKPEVLRYLKNAKIDLKPKVPNKTNSKQTVAANLPSGWTKEIKITRKDGKTSSDPTNSKQTVAENLPSGWTKEIKVTRKGGKTRRNPYYIDPVSGRHFRSIREVNHYLESNDLENAESSKDDPGLTNEELDHSKSSTVVAEEQRSIDKKEDKMLTGNESIKSEGAAVEKINPPETDAIEQREKEKDSVAEDGQQEKVATAPQNKRKKSKSKWMNDLPRRSSKRLARVEADPPLDEAQVNTINEAREKAKPLDEAQVNTIENINKSEISTSEDSGKQKEEVTHIQEEATHIQEKSTNIPLRDVSSVEKHEAVGNGTDVKKDEITEKQLDSSLNDLLMDPCIEFAIKTLTGAIPIEDVNKVNDTSVVSHASPNQSSSFSSALSLGNIWADPCFEFAVKTLTSEIPMAGGSHFQISFEQPLSSSGAGGCNSNGKFDPSMKN